MSRRSVKHDIDLANLPPLAAEQGAELEAPAPEPQLDEAFRRDARIVETMQPRW